MFSGLEKQAIEDLLQTASLFISGQKDLARFMIKAALNFDCDPDELALRDKISIKIATGSSSIISGTIYKDGVDEKIDISPMHNQLESKHITVKLHDYSLEVESLNVKWTAHISLEFSPFSLKIGNRADYMLNQKFSMEVSINQLYIFCDAKNGINYFAVGTYNNNRVSLRLCGFEIA